MPDNNEILLKVHVSPNSGRNEISGIHGDAINVRISAPAVDGKANSALTDFVSEYFGLKKKQTQIKSGEKSRNKTLRLLCTDEKQKEKIASAIEVFYNK
ncbi:MAG: DUF167 domain-containing protein [Firmicutes bacterium]|nr:DUF167 domain-containing protein [Bacillota bacterium]